MAILKWRFSSQSLVLRRKFGLSREGSSSFDSNGQQFDLGTALRNTKLLKENWMAESKELMSRLARSNQEPEMSQINIFLKRLERSGFYKEASPDLMQLFLENFSLDKLSKSAQEHLHSYLASFLAEGPYSVIIKIGLCLRIIELASDLPWEIKDHRLVSVSVSYIFEKAEFTNLSDRISLYNYSTILGETTELEQEQLANEIDKDLTTTKLSLLNDFDLATLLWSVTYQRYRYLCRELETGLKASMKPFSIVETKLIQLLFQYITRSSRVQNSRAWSR